MIANKMHDAGKVAADGTRIAGCKQGTPARTGAGIYTYTFRAGSSLDNTESVVIVTPNTAAIYVAAVHTSDTVLDVTSKTDAGVATDTIWSFIFLNLAD
jgi:hypothetical protein